MLPPRGASATPATRPCKAPAGCRQSARALLVRALQEPPPPAGKAAVRLRAAGKAACERLEKPPLSG